MIETLPAPANADEPTPKLTLEEAAAAVRDAQQRHDDAIAAVRAARAVLESANNECDAARDAVHLAQRELIEAATA